ncbi:MAG: NapC/NirT family cytochrome c [Bacteroidota bacterium]
MAQRFPKSFYNTITLVGVGLALLSLGTIAIMFLMDVFGIFQSPYIGIYTYLVLPFFLVIGLILIPIGITRQRRQLKKRFLEERKSLIIDLNIPAHRSAVMFGIVGFILFMFLSAGGSYEAYNYTESVEFCGKICHSVMRPEYTAYQHSPHARVTCVQCHIGEGADWFVRSKITGSYQVYATLVNVFPRPIPTPIRNLRPARETCEQCHWPQKFHGNKEMVKTYFPFDQTIPVSKIIMQIKTGGGMSELGPTEGIHWYMNTAYAVSYITTDEKRQVIPWIKAVSLDGKTKIFKSIDADISDTALAKGEYRKFDCLDCHNRPSHIYYPPFRSLNDAMSLNKIDTTLPGIRAIASDALIRPYSTWNNALNSIKLIIENAYREKSPEIAASKAKELENSEREVQAIYSRNFFPEMKVNWKAYPNNIGHLYDQGCFRCHDNKHISDDGAVLTNNCQSCHIIVSQGPLKKPDSSLSGLQFKHPADIGDAWKEMRCSECHTGE